MGILRLLSERKPSGGRDVDIRYSKSEDLDRIVSSSNVRESNIAAKSLKSPQEVAALDMGEVSHNDGRCNDFNDGSPGSVSTSDLSMPASGG